MVASTVTKIVNNGHRATALPRPWKALAETLGLGSIAWIWLRRLAQMPQCVVKLRDGIQCGCRMRGLRHQILPWHQPIITSARLALMLAVVSFHFTNTALIPDLLNEFSLCAEQTCAFRHAGLDGSRANTPPGLQ